MLDSSTAKSWTWIQRHGLWVVGISPIIANVIGSAFNIWYNHTQIEPKLSADQMQRFKDCWQWFNGVVYPIAITLYVVPLMQLSSVHRALLAGEHVAEDQLRQARRRVVNLPWWFLAVAGVGWLICIPVFPLVLSAGGEVLSSEVTQHLITSFLIASLIAVTQSFFAVELTTQTTLFPVFFQDANPASVSGAVPLSIRWRGILWAFSAVVCPVISLVLILVVPDAANSVPVFGIAVGTVAIGFGLMTSWMLGRWVATPLSHLQQAASSVAEGDLNARVSLLRSDDFGLLIERFNDMVDGLQQRERLQETFGRHVGREAARQILDNSGGLDGREQNITVMFVDVRNFTQQSATLSATQVVTALNLFFEDAVDVIEQHGGMVNKFLGDGLMAIFGVGTVADHHADRALRSAIALLQRIQESGTAMQKVGWGDLRIGIGINTGPAVVGSIGSPKRQEYTAIGDTVNVASRVESLTKVLGCEIVLTQSTQQQLCETFVIKPLPDQCVKGKAEPLKVYTIGR